MNNNLKPALEQWRAEQAEPMKQEPVAYQSKMSGVLRYGKQDDSDVPLYAAPVDAKAIRAEALEEAAKRVYDSTDWAHDERDIELKEVIAAAIRGLK